MNLKIKNIIKMNFDDIIFMMISSKFIKMNIKMNLKIKKSINL